MATPLWHDKVSRNWSGGTQDFQGVAVPCHKSCFTFVALSAKEKKIFRSCSNWCCLSSNFSSAIMLTRRGKVPLYMKSPTMVDVFIVEQNSSLHLIQVGIQSWRIRDDWTGDFPSSMLFRVCLCSKQWISGKHTIWLTLPKIARVCCTHALRTQDTNLGTASLRTFWKTNNFKHMRRQSIKTKP